MPTIGFGASHFTAADLTAARHTSDLEPRPETFLSLDHAQRGLGTASCGPDTAERYRLLEPRYSFGYSLRAMSRRADSRARHRGACRRDSDEPCALVAGSLPVGSRHRRRELARPRSVR